MKSLISLAVLAATYLTTFETLPKTNGFAMDPNNFNTSPASHNPQNQTPWRKPPPLPRTKNPLALLGFDWLSPHPNFHEIHRAYKTLAKRYHPDAAVGPDATPEERHAASLEFARINEAFEQLRIREEGEVVDCTMYIDGRKVVKSVLISEEAREKDPHRVNFERIAEMSRYRERHPRKKMWYEKKHDYTPRHNGEW